MFLCLFLFEGTFTLHNISKIKSHEEVTKQKKSRFFLLFLLDDGRILICTSKDPDPGGPKTYRSGSGTLTVACIKKIVFIKMVNTFS
jgi:hypothetical protein